MKRAQQTQPPTVAWVVRWVQKRDALYIFVSTTLELTYELLARAKNGEDDVAGRLYSF